MRRQSCSSSTYVRARRAIAAASGAFEEFDDRPREPHRSSASPHNSPSSPKFPPPRCASRHTESPPQTIPATSHGCRTRSDRTHKHRVTPEWSANVVHKAAKFHSGFLTRIDASRTPRYHPGFRISCAHSRKDGPKPSKPRRFGNGENSPGTAWSAVRALPKKTKNAGRQCPRASARSASPTAVGRTTDNRDSRQCRLNQVELRQRANSKRSPRKYSQVALRIPRLRPRIGRTRPLPKNRAGQSPVLAGVCRHVRCIRAVRRRFRG